MVNDVVELEQVLELLPEGVPLGVMIETPAAALLAHTLARRVRFLSVGSNDLAQYALAFDRTSEPGAGERWIVHPAELALIAQTAGGARASNIECGLCGELAGDPRVAPLLVGMGIGALSMATPRIPVVRDAITRRALALEDPRELNKLINLEL